MTKYAGFEVTIQWDPAGGTSFTTVGQVMDVNGPELSRGEIEVTTRDSTNYWEEYLKGFKSGGEITFDVVLDLALATHGTAATGILSDLADDSTIPNWRVNFPNSKMWTVLGFLTGFPPAAPLKDALTTGVTIRTTGEPTFV